MRSPTRELKNRFATKSQSMVTTYAKTNTTLLAATNMDSTTVAYFVTHPLITNSQLPLKVILVQDVMNADFIVRVIHAEKRY